MSDNTRPPDEKGTSSGIRRRIDSWLGQKQITADMVATPGERRFLKRSSAVLLAIAGLVIVGYMALSTLYSIVFVGTPVPRSTQLPPVQATPTAIVVVDVWADYGKLSQAEARDLRTKENVLNFGLMDGGGVTYLRDYGVKFDPTNKASWQMNDQPPGLSRLTVTGTIAQVVADAQTYTLNTYQGFARLKDPRTIYLVDKDGHIWSTQYSRELLVPLDQVRPPVAIPPNPNLSLTY